MRIPRPALAISLLALLGLMACKAPRPATEAPVGDMSGEWRAQTGAAGEMHWRLLLDEEDAGRLVGEGSLTHQARSSTFTVSGLRGERTVELELDLEGATGRFHGSLADPGTLVGRLFLDADTLLVTFNRSGA